MTVKELKEKLADGSSIYLIDVREPYEYEEFNIGGVNIPLNSIPTEMAKIKQSADDYDQVALLCRSGNRSGMATNLLQRAGISNAENVEGGILDWQDQFGLTQP